MRAHKLPLMFGALALVTVVGVGYPVAVIANAGPEPVTHPPRLAAAAISAQPIDSPYDSIFKQVESPEHARLAQIESEKGQALVAQWAAAAEANRIEAQAVLDRAAAVQAAAEEAAAAARPRTNHESSSPSAGTSQANTGGGGAGGGLATIRACESGGDYSTNTGNGFYGAYQFDQQTWESVGGSGSPANASPGEQDARAAQLQSERGNAPWPVCGRGA